MELKIWLERFYPKILSDFGFIKEEDEESARLIHELGKNKLMDCSVLKEKIHNRDVAVIGGALNSSDINNISKLEGYTVITAGKSILKLRAFIPNFIPDIHVTDMEESDEILIELERYGCILVLHAHGDNINRIKSVIPKLTRFIATTQSKPFDRVYNFTGFTDGDRAAIIAKEFGARSIRLIGFDFSNASDEIKLKKLKWAEKILKFEGII